MSGYMFFYKNIDFGGEGQIFLAIFQKVPQNMLSIFFKKQYKSAPIMLSIFLTEIFFSPEICEKNIFNLECEIIHEI